MATMRSIITTMAMLHTSSLVFDHPFPSRVIFVVAIAFPFPWYWKPPTIRHTTATMTTLHAQNSK
jgi:hypothetical protein